MGFSIFIFYFFLFLIFFVFSRKKGEKINYKVIFVIPALLAFFIFVLSVVKIYFMYKILLILIGIGLFVLTYWHWGASIRKWFG